MYMLNLEDWAIKEITSRKIYMQEPSKAIHTVSPVQLSMETYCFVSKRAPCLLFSKKGGHFSA